MGKWKKLIAIGLVVSMIMPSCIPQTLWAAGFSADDSVSVKEEFADGTEEEQLSENISKSGSAESGRNCKDYREHG